MMKVRHILLLVLYASTTLLLSGCKFAILDPKGIIATDEKNIMITATVLMLLVVVPVIVLSFAFAWRYREGNRKAVYSPNWSHSTLLEIICWSVPCLIIFTLGVITWTSTHRLDPYKPIVVKGVKPLTIQAISLEWKWLFIYPDQDIATINFVQIPKGVPVEFLVSAEGPMNSFQVPQLAGQIYAMAGMQTKLHLITNEEGDYQGISANFTGEGFSEMQFTVRCSTQKEFAKWVQSAKHAPEKLTMAAYNGLITPSTKQPVKYYSSANKDIFETVVMKSMMPMPMPTDETEVAVKRPAVILKEVG